MTLTFCPHFLLVPFVRGGFFVRFVSLSSALFYVDDTLFSFVFHPV